VVVVVSVDGKDEGEDAKGIRDANDGQPVQCGGAWAVGAG